jgi:predicted nucleic acid-binding Zn ribbon protein
MLFDPRARKAINIIWYIVVVLVIVSMVMLYMPGLLR